MKPKLKPDVKIIYNECIEKWYKPYNIVPPDRVVLAFEAASVMKKGPDRDYSIKRCINKAEMAYYGMWLREEIPSKPLGKPMSEETKAKLREYAKERREKLGKK